MRKFELLRNGVRLVCLPNPGFSTMVAMVGVQVGSRDEPEGMHGAAHFIEHMMFKGTKRRPSAIEISREVDGRGGENNAFTDKDKTCFYVRMPGKDGARAVDIVHDLVANPAFRSQDFEREREVILAEIQSYDDQSGALVHYADDAASFGNHPMAHPVIGNAASVKGMTPDSLRKFFLRHYIPQKMVVVLSGNLNDRTVEAAREKFGSLPQGGLAADRLPAKPKQHGLVSVTGPGEMVSILVRFLGYASGSVASNRANVAAIALGGYSSARLEQELREKRGLCYSVGSFSSSMSDHGSVYVSMDVEPKKVRETFRTLSSVLKDFSKKGPDEDEVRMVKSHVRGQLSMHLDSPMSVAMYACEDALSGIGKTQFPKLPAQRLREVLAVPHDGVRATARDFRPSMASVTVVGPKSAERAVKAGFRDFKS
jgi:predicted Zn-dependent peptidase